MILLISSLAVFFFVTGTPILLIIAGWVAAISYFVVDMPLANMGIGAGDNIKSFVFLAVPLFVATGDFLTEGGISRKLVEFARSLTASVPGRTSCAAILSSSFFAAVSGSNSATAATVGRMLGPELEKTGMKSSRAAAIVASGGIVGVIIPPSVIFVIYGITLNVSTVDLFTGGILPGFFLTAVMMTVVVFLARKEEPGVGIRGFSVGAVFKTGAEAWLGFMAIGLIFVGIYAGYFSPTEAAGMVAIFTLIAGILITREIKIKSVPSILMRSASITGMIVPLVAFSVQFQQVLGVLGAKEVIQGVLTTLGNDIGPMAAIAAMMLIILAVGAMTESVAVVLILGPILAPVAMTLGIDPVHWGVVFVVGTSIGFITPPYGLNLFVVSAVLNVPFGQVMKGIAVMILPLILAWIFIAANPWMSLLIQTD